MLTNKYTLLAVVLLVLLCFVLVACTSSSLIVSLQLVTDAVEVAIPVLAAAGVDPAALTLVQNYLTAVSTATQQATTELASTDTTAVKAGKIASYFAAAIAPEIANVQVSAVVKAVAAAVQEFLALLNPAPVTAAIAQSSVQPSFGDRRKLSSIYKQAGEHLKQLASLKH
jgi:Na+-transporting NADH:ubiquinone oxidoreductase subunit NqrC